MNVRRIIIIAVFCLILIGAVFDFFASKKQDALPIPPPPPQVFLPEENFIIQGRPSYNISDALASFDLSAPLPFFDERNATYSLNVENMTASSSRTYLSYRVSDKTIDELRIAYTEYFNRAGWMLDDAQSASTATTTTFLFMQNAEKGRARLMRVTFLKNTSEQSSDIAIGLFLHWATKSSDSRNVQ